ncbi:MAG: hypothetical protein M3065_12915 [Actinomycetota bacterium]|nr:hypothetical protein [Actinomycetota bacterium]
MRHRNRWFTAPEICDLVGEDAQIAFAPHDDRTVEVYWRGRWVATARAQALLSVGEQREPIEARAAHARELRNRQRALSRQARTRLAPLTDGGRTPVELPPAAPSEADQERIDAGERELRAGSRTDLLLERTGPPRARKAD